MGLFEVGDTCVGNRLRVQFGDLVESAISTLQDLSSEIDSNVTYAEECMEDLVSSMVENAREEGEEWARDEMALDEDIYKELKTLLREHAPQLFERTVSDSWNLYKDKQRICQILDESFELSPPEVLQTTTQLRLAQ